MSPEATVLGLISAVRATPLAIVYALLLSERPRRLLSGYLVAGLAVSLVTGLVIVATFDGSTREPESTATRYAVDAVLGIGALGYAALSATGRVGGGTREGPSALETALPGNLGQRLRTPTLPVATAAGAATNLPGLFYVAALVAVLETHPTPANGVFQVAVYNVLRFALPLAALALVVLRPDRTRSVLDSTRAWGRRNQRALVVGLCGTVGVYLTVKGVGGLLG